MSLALVVSLMVQATTPIVADSTLSGIRSPSFAPDGRLVVAAEGHLFVRTLAGRWVQLTQGPGWDRDPVVARDGKTIVFRSEEHTSELQSH